MITGGMAMDAAAIAAQVRGARILAGLTQAQLARRTGTTQSAVSRLESGRLLPTLAVLERVARATGAPIAVVIGTGATISAPAREPTPPRPQAPMASPAAARSTRPLPSAARERLHR
jgi:transcriptional regulator with XRE-family HTH domain